MRILRTAWVLPWTLAFCLFVCVSPAFADPLVVTGSDNAMALAQTLVGSGITITGATLTGGFSPNVSQQGTFTGGAGILPFDAGVLLTSGSIQNAVGPNDSSSATLAWGNPGNAQLNTLIPGYTTYDANVLTFTFIPDSDVVSFQYVFGSEEYNEYTLTAFNDVFGFFLNGTNIAMIPGTSTPVSINNVNCTNNAGFYTDNGGGSGAAGSCGNAGLNTQYDGLVGAVTPLYAQGAVNKGVENTITLAIADAGDYILDSGVFLKAGSFTDQPAPMPEPGTILMLCSGLAVLPLLRKKRQ